MIERKLKENKVMESLLYFFIKDTAFQHNAVLYVRMLFYQRLRFH